MYDHGWAERERGCNRIRVGSVGSSLPRQEREQTIDVAARGLLAWGLESFSIVGWQRNRELECLQANQIGCWGTPRGWDARRDFSSRVRVRRERQSDGAVGMGGGAVFVESELSFTDGNWEALVGPLADLMW